MSPRLAAAVMLLAAHASSWQLPPGPVPISEIVRTLGVDGTGLPGGAMKLELDPGYATLSDEVAAFAGRVSGPPEPGNESILLAVRSGPRPWRLTTLPTAHTDPFRQLSPAVTLKRYGEVLMLQAQLAPSVASTTVVRVRELREVGRFSGWVQLTLPPNLLIFSRSMIHFAPAHSESLALFDVMSGVEVSLYPPGLHSLYGDGEPSTPARKAFAARLRPIFRKWKETEPDRTYGFNPDWFDVSYTGLTYDASTDRLTFTATMSSRHPASVAPPETKRVTVVCSNVRQPKRTCVER